MLSTRKRGAFSGIVQLLCQLIVYSISPQSPQFRFSSSATPLIKMRKILVDIVRCVVYGHQTLDTFVNSVNLQKSPALPSLLRVGGGAGAHFTFYEITNKRSVYGSPGVLKCSFIRGKCSPPTRILYFRGTEQGTMFPRCCG